ncbi:DNA polymerase III subunit gamma/tau [Treponema sp.]
MDVIEIDGASNTSVNDVRQIKDEVLFPPNASPYKVYIIDEVHMLSNSAFNALLKTIEEPPPYIIFIFATTELHKVPATIKSRCQQFNFRLFSVDTIKSLLAEACQETGIEAEDEALFWIAKEATGSMRDAYTLLDQVVAFSDGHLRASLIREKLGLLGLDAVNEVAEACAAGKVAEALSGVDTILQRGVSVEQFVIDLASYYRSLLLLKNGIDKEALLGSAKERFSPEVLDALSSLQIEKALSLLLDLYRNIRFSVSPRFELETVVSKLSWLSQWVSPIELRAAIADVRGRLLIPQTLDPGGGSLSKSPSIKPDTEATVDFTADEMDLAKPGAFTETFKRLMADKEGKPFTVPAQPEKKLEETRVEMEGISFEEPLVEVEDGELDDSESMDQVPMESPLFNHEDIREATIKVLKKERGMLASGLEKSLPWVFEGEIVSIASLDRMSAELLRKDIQVINQALNAAMLTAGMGGSSIYKVEIIEAEPTGAVIQGKQEIPIQIENVRRLFRGTILRNA